MLTRVQVGPSPRALLLRRDALKLLAAGASTLLPGCIHPQRPPPDSGSAGDPLPAIIDAHCHVFNAADLPVGGFVRRVVLHDAEDQVILGENRVEAQAALPWLAGVLVEILSSQTKSARQELEEITRGAVAGPLGVGEDPVATVGRALARVLGAPGGVSPALRGQGGTPPDPDGRDILLREMRKEAGAGVFPQAAEGDFDALAAGLLSGQGTIGRHLGWAEFLTRDRRTITARLIELYGRNRRVALFTPALIDFSLWLDDEGGPRSPLEDQIRVMERIQRLQTGPALHCMVPYDPWRQVHDVETGTRGPKALDLVRMAVEEMGFVGIKLYPPMGFRPLGNAAVRQAYPERAQGIRNFPAKLDRALDDLYQYASDRGVPIMAHATNSNGAAPGYAERAHPDNWLPVLRKYPKLRLNLAHFGDFQGATGTDASTTWEHAVGRLVKRYPANAYSDLSYFSELLPGLASPEHRTALLEFTGAFVREFDPGGEHLLYGSDWIMLGREANAERYLDVVSAAIRTVCSDDSCLDRFMWGNASRYLGLRPGEPNRMRLDHYYDKHRLDASWLRSLDTMSGVPAGSRVVSGTSGSPATSRAQSRP